MIANLKSLPKKGRLFTYPSKRSAAYNLSGPVNLFRTVLKFCNLYDVPSITFGWLSLKISKSVSKAC